MIITAKNSVFFLKRTKKRRFFRKNPLKSQSAHRKEHGLYGFSRKNASVESGKWNTDCTDFTEKAIHGVRSSEFAICWCRVWGFAIPFDGCGFHGNKVFYSGKCSGFFGKTREKCVFSASQMLDIQGWRIANPPELGK